MTKFLDGPAVGVVLGLSRAPLLLRVVHNSDRKDPWDALDQINDRPQWGETIHVYRQVSYDGHVHVCRRPRGGGYFAIATYTHIPDAPVADLRDTAKWREWAAEYAAQAKATPAKGAV